MYVQYIGMFMIMMMSQAVVSCKKVYLTKGVGEGGAKHCLNSQTLVIEYDIIILYSCCQLFITESGIRTSESPIIIHEGMRGIYTHASPSEQLGDGWME